MEARIGESSAGLGADSSGPRSLLQIRGLMHLDRGSLPVRPLPQRYHGPEVPCWGPSRSLSCPPRTA